MFRATDAASWYLGAYWSGRSETTDACIDHLREFLDASARVRGDLRSWVTDDPQAAHRIVGSRASVRLENDVSGISALGGRASMGLTIGLSTDTEDAAGIIVKCGTASISVPNSVVLNPSDRSASEWSDSDALALLDAAITSWNPDWACWITPEIRRCQRMHVEPFIGPMTYLSKKYLGYTAHVEDRWHVKTVDNGQILTYICDRDPHSQNTSGLLQAIDEWHLLRKK